VESKSGNFGRPVDSSIMKLPDVVEAHIKSFEDHTDSDWTMFAEYPGGPLWMLVRCWDDPYNYNIVASVVRYESEMIEFR